jgi:hypothetical protein
MIDGRAMNLRALTVACLLAGCSGQSGAEPVRPAPTTSSQPKPTQTATPASAQPKGSAVKTLAQRVDLTLRPDVPVEIPGVGLTVRLLSAKQVRLLDPNKGAVNDSEAVIEVVGAGAPQVLRFGRGQRTHAVADHTLAVFGGTVLTVFPPGAEVMP